MEIDELLRTLAPPVVGILSRRSGDFDASEDAVQEALLAAHLQWPAEGIPQNPRGWLLTVAQRRLTDAQRSELARRRREEAVAARELAGEPEAREDEPATDDTLTLLLLCCHPALSPASQIALTLRAVGGLTTAEIARAFLTTQASMAQRISRAKATIRANGSRFELPAAQHIPARLRVVEHVLYLIFNEGYTASAGDDLVRPGLTAEAIRLTRLLHAQVPDDGEVTGLLALMLLTDARRAARTAPSGALITLDDQDRSLWDAGRIAEGTRLAEQSLSRGRPGPYGLQAAIAAVHDAARTPEETDWAQIRALYLLLVAAEPSPVVRLNLAVATAMVHGPQAGLTELADLDHEPALTATHRLDATRAHLLQLAGDHEQARHHYERAAARATSAPEREYLELEALAMSRTTDRLRPDGEGSTPTKEKKP